MALVQLVNTIISTVVVAEDYFTKCGSLMIIKNVLQFTQSGAEHGFTTE